MLNLFRRDERVPLAVNNDVKAAIEEMVAQHKEEIIRRHVLEFEAQLRKSLENTPTLEISTYWRKASEDAQEKLVANIRLIDWEATHA